MSTQNTCTWTDEDFRIVFLFLRDIGSCLADSPQTLHECRDLLRGECNEAARRLSRIADAVGAFT